MFSSFSNEIANESVHLQKFAPMPEEAKPVLEYNIPIGERHFQVEGLLTAVLGIVEGELVKVLKLGTVSNFPLQTRQLLLKFVQRITAAIKNCEYNVSLRSGKRLTPWLRALARTLPW